MVVAHGQLPKVGLARTGSRSRAQVAPAALVVVVVVVAVAVPMTAGRLVHSPAGRHSVQT